MILFFKTLQEMKPNNFFPPTVKTNRIHTIYMYNNTTILLLLFQKILGSWDDLSYRDSGKFLFRTHIKILNHTATLDALWLVIVSLKQPLIETSHMKEMSAGMETQNLIIPPLLPCEHLITYETIFFFFSNTRRDLTPWATHDPLTAGEHFVY